MEPQVIPDSVWDRAETAQVRPSTYFGQVALDAWYVVLYKGCQAGGEPFDPQRHKESQKRLTLHIMITPLPSSNATFTTERKLLEDSRDFAAITLPSVKPLGIRFRDLNGKWVRYEMVPTGREYEAKDQSGNKTGEMKQATTFRFLAVYDTLEAAEAAAAELYGGNAGGEHPEAPTNGDNGTTATPDDAGRDIALKFLPALWKQSGKDLTRFATILAGNPLVAKHFDLTSPEVIALVSS